jgi:hypothetical protein
MGKMRKIKVAPVLNKASHHEDVLGEWRYASAHSLISALDGAALRLGRFTQRERTLETHWTGSWIGPTASVDTVPKKIVTHPCRDSNPDNPIVQLIVSRNTD